MSTKKTAYKSSGTSTKINIVSLLDLVKNKANSIQVPINVNDTPLSGTTGKPDTLPPTDLPIFQFDIDENDKIRNYKYLFRAGSITDDFSGEVAFAIFLNLLNTLLPGIVEKKLKTILKSLNYELLEIDFLEYANTVEPLSEVDWDDMSEFDDLQSNHVQAVCGIICCFIGRNLTADNATTWLLRRSKAFAQACGADPDNDSYVESIPSMQFASKVYATVASKFQLRREIFSQLRILSKGDSIWATSSKVTMTYLSGAEMNNFLLINRYILVENPILLAWNELSKHSWAICAAFAKWEQMRDDAPYCKFLYPQEELSEFNRQKLEPFAAVARAIAENEGQLSLKHFKGTAQNEKINNIVEKALIIVGYYGGAITHNTFAVDRSILIEKDNKDLREQLHRGAEIELVDPENRSTGDHGDDLNPAGNN